MDLLLYLVKKEEVEEVRTTHTPSNMGEIREALLDIVPDIAKRVNVGVDDKVSEDSVDHIFVWEIKNTEKLPEAQRKEATERAKERIKLSKKLTTVCDVVKVRRVNIAPAGSEERVDGHKLQSKLLVQSYLYIVQAPS